MESSTDGYHISFFKPTTERARLNRNLTIWLVSIWFIAIFGFQIILKIIGNPVPQEAYISYEKAWSNINGGNYSEQDVKELAKSSLSVLGKIIISPEAKMVLDDVFSWSVYQLSPVDVRTALLNDIKNYEKVNATINTIDDKVYIQLKSSLSAKISSLLDLQEQDVRREIIPFALESDGMGELNPNTKMVLPEVMQKYLIHNQSILTDFRFLGFPFHYFYTAVFLLILFVGLCLIYCLKTDSMNKKLEFAD